MNKKFLSLVLALVMVLGTFGSVFAETKAPEAKDTKKATEVKVPEKKDNNEKVQWLVDNEVVAGRTVNKDDKNADLALDKNIQRAEVTKLLIYAIGEQDLAKRLDGLYAPYKDVASNHWANGLIAAGSTVASPANALPFLHGVGHNMFEPERQVRYDELAKMLVVLVKEDLTKAGLEAAKWPTDWMNWAAKLGIFDGIKTPVDGSKYAVREDAFVMLYNALYKIGELRNLPANETVGIISAASLNKLTLNQGKIKKDFTVSANTNFVPGKYEGRGTREAVNWTSFGDTSYVIGSLVRVIADEKGNVSHIIQLGNPVKLGFKESQGWTGLAQKVENFNEVVLGDLSKLGDIKTVSATRYFVADYKNNQLTEVKDADAALALFERTTEKAKRVYVGYDVLTNSKIKEAKVVVFNEVDKSNIQKDLVRVVTPGSNKFTATAEKPGYYPTTAQSFDLLGWKAGWPLSYGIEKQDVIKIDSEGYEMIIDHSKANIYKIVDIDTEKIDDIKKVGGRTVEMELADKYGKRKVDIVSDADLFFGSQIRKGAFVQVRFVNESATKPAVDIVSVVSDTETRGFLPYGKDNRQVTGTVASIEEFKAGEDGYIVFTLKNSDNPYGDVYVARNNAFDKVAKDIKSLADAQDRLIGKEITFKSIASNTQYHKLPLATNIMLKSKFDEAEQADKDLADKLVTEKEKNIKFLTNPDNRLTPEQRANAEKETKEAKTLEEANQIRAYYVDLNAQQGEAQKLEERSSINYTYPTGKEFKDVFKVGEDVSAILNGNGGTRPSPAAKAKVVAVKGNKVTVEITRQRTTTKKTVPATTATVVIENVK